MFIIEKDKLRYVDTDATEVQASLLPGVYDIEIQKSFFGKSILFQKNKSHVKGKVVESGNFKSIKDYIEDYFSEAAKLCRQEMQLPTRIGLLFKGEPGTGKTFLACRLAQQLVETENAVAIVTNSPSDLDLPQTVDFLRKDDPNRLIIFIWDEFEKDWENCNQAKMLGFLDGTNSRDNIMVIATVNNVNRLPNTLTERPGRFELVRDFKLADESVAMGIIESMIPEKYRESIDKKELFFKLPKNFTIDNIKVVVRNAVTVVIKDILEKVKLETHAVALATS